MLKCWGGLLCSYRCLHRSTRRSSRSVVLGWRRGSRLCSLLPMWKIDRRQDPRRGDEDKKKAVVTESGPPRQRDGRFASWQASQTKDNLPTAEAMAPKRFAGCRARASCDNPLFHSEHVLLFQSSTSADPVPAYGTSMHFATASAAPVSPCLSLPSEAEQRHLYSWNAAVEHVAYNKNRTYSAVSGPVQDNRLHMSPSIYTLDRTSGVLTPESRTGDI